MKFMIIADQFMAIADHSKQSACGLILLYGQECPRIYRNLSEIIKSP